MLLIFSPKCYRITYHGQIIIHVPGMIHTRTSCGLLTTWDIRRKQMSVSKEYTLYAEGKNAHVEKLIS
jgi:hypothetical protein